ncbi:alpha-hydroxy-acid oxidizing protein [Pectobacteriaceae bacterium CE90]|nr:alpha-hydroxy-acid oxidizing protein [Pectobacteriaceae bacterium CE90]
MVLLGRVALYGLAAAGEQSVTDIIRLLKEDIDRTLVHIGAPAVSALGSAFVHQRCVPLTYEKRQDFYELPF